jgi:hypothetical protein
MSARAATPSLNVRLADTRVAQSTKQRLIPIDALRGLLLVFMAVNHIPSPLHAVTDQPLGYMSAAEVFIFMAGLMAGRTYTATWRTRDFSSLRRACFQRAATIYRWHIGTFVAVIASFMIAGSLIGELPVNTPETFLHQPAHTLFAVLLLIQQPTLFDILPLYCVLLLITPTCLRVCVQGHHAHLILGSLGLWSLTNIFCPQAPYVHGLLQTGAFNLAAWQLLYIAGLVFGHRWSEREAAHHSVVAPPSLRREIFLIPAPSFTIGFALGGLAIALACARHGLLAFIISDEALAALTNKNNLAPLRLLNTALLLYAGYFAITRFPQVFSWRAFASIGRASLPVFCVHILVAYALQASPALFAESLRGRWLATLCMLAAISLTARAHMIFGAKKSNTLTRGDTRLARLHTRQPRVSPRILRHEPRSPHAADSLHRRSG